MTWTKLDDAFNDDPRLIQLPRGVRLLHVEALVWCNKHETDGAVPAYAMRRVSDEPDVDAAIGALVDVGLWTDLGDGQYQLPGWAKDAKHQRTKSELEQGRRGNRFIVGRKRMHDRGDHRWCTKGDYCKLGALSPGDAARYSRGESEPPDLTCPDQQREGTRSEPPASAVAPLGVAPAHPPRLTVRVEQ